MDNYNNSTCTEQQQKGEGETNILFYIIYTYILWIAIITVPALISSTKMKLRCKHYYIFYG